MSDVSHERRDSEAPWSGPTTEDWVDAAFLCVLSGLALVGFATSYGGRLFMVSGLIGVLGGLIVGFVTARRRQPAVVVAALVVLAFFTLGPVAAARDEALLGILPSVGALRALADGAVTGWMKLLTTLTPVGDGSNLLTIPFVCGLLSAVVGWSLARRTGSTWAPVLAPAAVLLTAILFGTETPYSVLLQGGVFSVVALGWVAARQRVSQPAIIRSSSRARVVGAIGMLAVAASVSVFVGESLPGSETNDRFILRDRAEPPFDPRAHPSPLNGYRRYVKEPARDDSLFTVEGLPEGARIRLATMDTYDGVVWRVSATADEASGHFQRVGETVETSGGGERVRLAIEIDGYRDVWVPNVGELSSIAFDGPRSDALEEAFRYNLATDTAVVTTGLVQGDRYTLDAELVPEPADLEALRGTPVSNVGLPTETGSPEIVERRTAEILEGSDRGFAAALEMAQHLQKRGFLSDGGPEHPVPAGHGARHIIDFLEADYMVGNGEQYAATLALALRAQGVPSRVVMGFRSEQSGEVEIKGESLQAWVEVPLDGIGWVPLDATPEDTNVPQQPPPAPPVEEDPSPSPPPPPVTQPPLEAPSSADECEPDVDGETETGATGSSVPPTSMTQPPDEAPSTDEDNCPDPPPPLPPEDPGIPTWVAVVTASTLGPFFALGGALGSIVWVKQRRRRRRQERGPASTRIASGWAEVSDLAIDLGSPIPPRTTRREAAHFLGDDAAVVLASQIDEAVWCGEQLNDEDVEVCWGLVDQARTEMLGHLGRIGRLKVLANLSSFRRGSEPSNEPRRVTDR